MNEFLKKIDGLKTILAIVAGGIVMTAYGLDCQLHDLPETPDIIEVKWLSSAMYGTLATMITSVGGVTFMMKLNKINANLTK